MNRTVKVKDRLSSADLYNLLKSSQIEKFCIIVSKYFSQNSDLSSGISETIVTSDLLISVKINILDFSL